jgi:hypothetical protein
MKLKMVSALLVLVTIGAFAQEWEREDRFDFDRGEGISGAWFDNVQGERLAVWISLDDRSNSAHLYVDIYLQESTLSRTDVRYRFDGGSAWISSRSISGVIHQDRGVQLYGDFAAVVISSIKSREAVEFEIKLADRTDYVTRFELPTGSDDAVEWVLDGRYRYGSRD